MRECQAAWRFGVSVREYREIEAGDPLADLRDVGPDLQAVRVAADVHQQVSQLASISCGVDDRAVSVTGLGAWCDFVTEDEYRQRLVRDGWPAEEIENLVEDFKRGVSFDVHEFADLADGRRLTLHEERGSLTGPAASGAT